VAAIFISYTSSDCDWAFWIANGPEAMGESTSGRSTAATTHMPGCSSPRGGRSCALRRFGRVFEGALLDARTQCRALACDRQATALSAPRRGAALQTRAAQLLHPPRRSCGLRLECGVHHVKVVETGLATVSRRLVLSPQHPRRHWPRVRRGAFFMRDALSMFAPVIDHRCPSPSTRDPPRRRTSPKRSPSRCDTAAETGSATPRK